MACRSESVTAFNIRDFETGIDTEGHLVMRLTYKENGATRQKTFALDFEQGLRFVTAFVRAVEQAEKYRNSRHISEQLH